MTNVLDIDALLARVPGDNPAGPDLVYDPAYGAFERSAVPKPARIMGDKVIPAEDPDWPVVLAEGQALLARSKDLRIALAVAEAATRLQGLAGHAAGLALVQRLLEVHWDGLYPRLDADDNNDPTERVNCLMQLVDPDRNLGALRAAPLVESRPAGRYSYRDCQIAAGELQAPVTGDKAPPDQALIDAAFGSAEIGGLQATASVLAQAVASFGAIEAVLASKLAIVQLPRLDPLGDMLKAMNRMVTAQLARRGAGAVAGGEAPGDGEPGAVPAGARTVAGEIRSRDDVTRTLDRLCVYFEQNEPSSPVPLLLRRAKRLVSADFMTIIKDLAPGGTSDAEAIAGKRDN